MKKTSSQETFLTQMNVGEQKRRKPPLRSSFWTHIKPRHAWPESHPEKHSVSGAHCKALWGQHQWRASLHKPSQLPFLTIFEAGARKSCRYSTQLKNNATQVQPLPTKYLFLVFKSNTWDIDNWKNETLQHETCKLNLTIHCPPEPIGNPDNLLLWGDGAHSGMGLHLAWLLDRRKQ